VRESTGRMERNERRRSNPWEKVEKA